MNKEQADYDVPCHMLPETDLDMCNDIPAHKIADVPVGGLVRDIVLHEATDLISEAAQKTGLDESGGQFPKNEPVS